MTDDTQTQTQEQTATLTPTYKMSSGIPSPDEYNAVQEAVVTDNVDAAPTSEPPAESTNVPTTDTIDTADTTEAKVDDNSSTFSMPTFGEDGAMTTEADAVKDTPAVVATDWKEEIKKANVKDVLKELGYDDFVAEFAEFRKNGGDAYKYLEAKALDWNKVTPEELVLNDLKVQYPHLTNDKIEKLYQAKYKQSEYSSDEDREIGSIQLEADAESVRQKRINEQKSFQIPEIARPQEVDNQLQVAEQQRIQAEQSKQVIKFFQEHEATKSLYSSKRVAIDLGDNGKFNFNVDKPENLMSIALDGEKWQRAISVNPQEADPSKLIPDVAKLQKIALVALNPNYEKDLVNYGKSLGLKAIVEEGQNAKRPTGSIPSQSNESLAEAIKTRSRVSTLGG